MDQNSTNTNNSQNSQDNSSSNNSQYGAQGFNMNNYGDALNGSIIKYGNASQFDWSSRGSGGEGKTS